MKIATVKYLPEIIRYGEVINEGVSEYHTNNPDLQYTYIQHPVTIDGKTMYVAVDIRQSKQTNMFWVHGVYVDAKKDKSLVTSSEDPKQAVNKDLAIDEMVAQTKDESKGKFSLKDNRGRHLSDGQSEYFKDSKARDADGNLKVMYQGGNSNLAVFERKKRNRLCSMHPSPRKTRSSLPILLLV